MVTQKESSLQYPLHSQVYCFAPWTPFSVLVPLGAATSPMGYWALSRRRGEQGIARTDTNVCLAGKASRPSSDFKKMICHDNDGLKTRNQIRRKCPPPRGGHLAAAEWYIFAPARRYNFSPALTSEQWKGPVRRRRRPVS